MADLKPCPFCGGKADTNGSISCNYGKHMITADFLCLDCGARVKLKIKFVVDPIKEVIEAWNRRANDE